MNFTDRISNQTTIYYSQGKYNRQLSKRLSSPNLRSPKNQKHGKESTKQWVARSFYSEPTREERNSASTVTDVKPSAANVNDHANTSPGNSVKDYTDTNKISYHGKPAIFFQQSIIDSQAEKFKFCLVGKFPRWRPSLSQIRDWVTTKWQLKGNSSISLLDHRHVFIRLDNEADMLHVWTRSRWFIGGHLMRVFKWSPTFVPSNGEPSSAAIWVSFPSLPLAFFQEELLFPIAALAGKVLAMDGPTRNLTRTNVARVCVEVDLLKELPRQVWVGIGDGGFWQDIYYWRLPTYCSNCRGQGHSTQVCQANGSDSQSRAPKPKKNLNSSINKGKCSKVYSGESKRVRISPIIEHEEGSTEPLRLGSSQSSLKKKRGKEIVGRKGEGISDDSSKGFSSGHAEKNMYTEATAHRGESSYARIERTLSAWNSNGMINQGVDVTGKSKFSETAAEGGKGFVCYSEEEGESFGQVVRKSPPRRQNISSKMLNFLWRRKLKDRTPKTQLRFDGNVRRVRTQSELRTESEFGCTLPLRSHEIISLSHLTKFHYSEIVKMTGSFRHVVGKGGFGTVFKGILPDGQEVAVKVKGQSSYQGENEFYKEIQVFKNTRHVNIIRFFGFCSEGRNRILVSEFMPMGSLDKIIYSEESSLICSKDSKKLCEIAIGTARGLEYLHHGCDPPILHLDVKPHNILLDEELRPKLTDFGISHITLDSSDSVSTIIRGTPGYLDPDFYISGRVSRSIDVYSYGVTLLEMALGRKAITHHVEISDDRHILAWVRRRVTPVGGIRGMVLDETQRKMAIVGIWCTLHDTALRPSFGRIIHMLEGSLDDLSLPISWTEENVDNGIEFGTNDHSISDSSLTGR